MSYEELLKKYIKYVLDMEGTTFIPHSPELVLYFTPEEIVELQKIDEETEYDWTTRTPPRRNLKL